MAKRIVQMLVTCAVDTDRTRAEVREQVEEALHAAIIAPQHDVTVELVESRAPSSAKSCICGPDSTGEAPDERPDCPVHGVNGSAWAQASDTAEAPF